MIGSFGNKVTEALFMGQATKDTRQLPVTIHKRTQKLLDLLHNAHTLNDIVIYPGTRFEKLKGNLNPFYSIRINDQWRIMFQWTDNQAFLVQIIDYH